MKSTERLIISFAAGVGLGAILGLLFAPSKGSETRKRIKDGVEHCCTKVGELVDDFKEMVANYDQEEDLIEEEEA